MNKNIFSFVTILALLLAALACNISTVSPQGNPDAVSTAVALTAQIQFIQMTQTALAAGSGVQPVVPPQIPTQPASQGAAAPTPVPTQPQPAQGNPPAATPCDWAGFVNETIPDGTKLKPGERFTKSWTLKNKGSCPWTSGYTLVFDHGDQMGASAVSPLTAASVTPGGNVQVAVTLTAPNQPGTYQGFFMVKSPSGKKFGLGDNADKAFWVKIEVKAVATAATVHKSGTLDIPQTFTADLDSGVIGPASGADLRHAATTDTDRFLEFWVPAMVMHSKPSYNDCKNVTLMDGLSLDSHSTAAGTYICYRTTEGRLGFVKFNGFGFGLGSPDVIFLEFTTWTTP